MFADRVLSGMRPTGRMHIGHYHGALRNWVRLQEEYECLFFAADWHALTTHYEEREVMGRYVYDMVIDWIAAGLDPDKSTIFIQSRLPEHAELFTLLAMGTPLGWLERVPTYKDQIDKLKDRDLATYGFLGYPLLQSADILIYGADKVPVGEDQVAHVELTREVARRFNHIFGRSEGYEEAAQAAIKKMGKKNARLYRELLKRYQEQGDHSAVDVAQALLAEQQNLALSDRERLLGYLEGGGRMILTEPTALLTPASKMPGLDGQKMSKSYNNTISLREAPAAVQDKLRTMPTDPARIRRTDPGNPDICPVWQLHQVYSNHEVKDWVRAGCTSAGIGCLDCKQPIIDGILTELKPIQERAREFEQDPGRVRAIIHDGSEAARDVARQTLAEVREVMGLKYY